jgi:dihydrofolate reductase
MQPLVLKMSISIDGFVGTPEGGVARLIGLSDEASTAWTVAAISGPSAHLMGRKTFRDMAAWWPTSTEPYAEPMNRIPKIVFTRSPCFRPDAAGETTGALSSVQDLRGDLPTTAASTAALASWRHPEVLSGDLATEIVRLKRREGNFLLAHGGASFARSLIASGEVDEYRLLVHPTALGRGLPLFDALTAPLELELIESRAFPVGAVAQVYRPRNHP